MRGILVGGSAAIACLIPATAWAQVPTESEREAQNDTTILVTAERRAQSVQETPTSIVALSGAELAERGITNIETLQAEVPSLSYTDQGNVKFFNIRGVGISEGAPNQTVGVAVHWDGAYIAREFVFGDSFFDVASIEVLRGPQGTYVGQNSSGGALFLNSVRPDFNGTSGFAEVTLGNLGRKQIGAGVTVQLSDQFAARVSGELERKNSSYLNLGPLGVDQSPRHPNQPGNLSRYIGRAQLLFEPNADFDVLLMHQVSDRKSDSLTYQRPTLYEFGDRTIAYDTEQAGNVAYNRTTLISNYRGLPGFDVRLTAYHHTTEQLFIGDNDTTTERLNPQIARDEARIIIEDEYYGGELNLISSNEGPFQWTLGATFLDYHQPGIVETYPYGDAVYIYVVTQRNNQAIFGEVSYEVTPGLEFRLGGRYNWDETGFGLDSYFNPAGVNGPTIPLTTGMHNFEEWTGRAVVNWEVSPDHFLYATVSKGYKPGGTTLFGTVYNSERVINYEAGWKGALLNRALTTSLSAFQMSYRDYQTTYAPDINNPISVVTENVDGTRIRGIEGQVALDLGGLRTDASFSVLDATYGDLELVQPAGLFGNGQPAAPVLINLKGRTVPFAPKFSGSAGLRYTFAAGDAEITPSLRVTHQSSQWATFYQAHYHELPARTLVNGRITYDSGKDWQLAVYANNILDKDYKSSVNQATDGVGAYMLGQPREFGATLGYRF